jgi:uncharacterized Fe-S cluster protein YjdI
VASSGVGARFKVKAGAEGCRVWKDCHKHSSRSGGGKLQLETAMTSTYEGRNAIITYEEKVCIHAGECVKGLPQVFDTKRTPWLQPGDVAYETAEQVVRRCPSGALKIRDV